MTKTILQNREPRKMDDSEFGIQLMSHECVGHVFTFCDDGDGVFEKDSQEEPLKTMDVHFFESPMTSCCRELLLHPESLDSSSLNKLDRTLGVSTRHHRLCLDKKGT